MSALPQGVNLDAVLDTLADRIAARISIPERTSADWLTSDQAAHELKVAVNTLEIWRHKGKGPRFFKLSRNVCRYKRSDIEAFMESDGRTSTSAPVNKRKRKEAA